MNKSSNEAREPVVAVVAHEVSIPITEHRRIEFMNRIIYFTKHFPNFFVISRDSEMDCCKIEHDKSTGISVYRVPHNVIPASLYIKEIVKKNGVDILFADTNSDGYSSLYSRFSNKRPLNILFLQGFPSHLETLALRNRLCLEVKRSWIEPFLAIKDSLTFNLCDAVFCVSSSLAKYVKGLIPRRKWSDVYYIPHSLEYIKRLPDESLQYAKAVIDDIKRGKNLDRSVHMVCYVGGLTKNKRPDIAVSTLAHIIRKGTNAILLIIGDGPLKPQLKQLARYLKVEERVIFLGSQPQYCTIALVSKCSALIFPSLSEGFSMAIAEAMAVGCPVISFAHETAMELAENGGIILVNRLNPREFAEKAIRMLNREDSRKEIVEKGKQTISPYLNFQEDDRFKLMVTYMEEAYEKWHRY